MIQEIAMKLSISLGQFLEGQLECAARLVGVVERGRFSGQLGQLLFQLFPQPPKGGSRVWRLD